MFISLVDFQKDWGNYNQFIGSLEYFIGSWCWQNDCKRPVLKHGPRSLTYMQVEKWLKLECIMKVTFLKWDIFFIGNCTIDQSRDFSIDLSESISVGTRKTVNYAWVG